MTLPFAAPALWCLLAAALFGASTPVAKALLGDVGPVTLAGLFYAGAALATAPSALRQPWTRAELPRLVGACLFGGVLGPILVLLGLRLAPAGSVALWLNLEAPATALLGWAFFKEHIGRRTWAAAGLTWLASVVLVGPAGGADVRAALLVAAGCFCWGLDNNLTAVIASYSPAQTTFVKGLVAATVNLTVGLSLEGAPTGGVAGALVVGALSYGASIVLYVAGAQQLGATRAQTIFATAPFWGVVLAWVREPILVAQVLAGALMAGALALVYGERHTHPHTHEALRHTHWHRHDDGHHGHTHPEGPVAGWHSHPHEHEAGTHTHPHVPDLHHRHEH